MKRDSPGGRHSNDFEDISDIQVMPTYDEVTSACTEYRTEYLPHFNYDENHFQGLPDLFDRQFRLLREDTVGQVRDAAKIEIGSLQHPGESEKIVSNGARVCSYKNAKIENLVPDSRAPFGFKLEVSFDQPARGVNGEKARREW